ncbi:unnamed protein product, partial [Ilex paraguariensis]
LRAQHPLCTTVRIMAPTSAPKGSAACAYHPALLHRNKQGHLVSMAPRYLVGSPRQRRPLGLSGLRHPASLFCQRLPLG